MNTSFPSAASDFASLLAGGKQPNTNAQLKGIFAGLACSKPGKGESAGLAKPDFEAMLAAPASSEHASQGAANSATDSAGQPVGDAVSRAVAAGWCILMTDLNAGITTTLQIKGMGNGSGEPVLPEIAAALSEIVAGLPENPVLAQAFAPAAEALPVPMTPAAATTVPTILVNAAPLVVASQPGPISPKKEITPGPAVPRQIKLMPGCGQSLRGGGLNPALIVHTGLKGRNSVPAPADPAAENPVVTVLPVPPVAPGEVLMATLINGNGQLPVVPANPVENVIDPVVAPEIPTILSPMPVLSLENAGSTIPTNFSPAAPTVAGQVTDFGLPGNLQSESSTSPNQSVLPNATLAPDLVAVPTGGPIAIFSNAQTSTLPTQAILPTALGDEGSFNSGLVATFVATDQPVPVATADQTPVATAFEIPAAENVQATTEVAAADVEVAETNSLTPEVRRDVIETVAAMLAPFLMNLPLIPPELFPNQAAAPAGDALTAGGSAMKSLTVTVKIGDQSRFSFELPQPGLSENGTNEILAASTAMDETGDRPDHAPAAFLLPAAMARLADGAQPLDFRVQLKAIVEAAWPQAEDTAETASTPAVPLPVVSVSDVLPALSPVTGRAVVAAPSPVVPETSQPMAKLDSVANPSVPAMPQPEQAHTANRQAKPIELTVELPGLVTLTAQIVASEVAPDSLGKKFGARSGRAEKSAGDFKSVRLNGTQENTGFEKTFLSAGAQPLKGKAGNAGTAVANSDDTMPASFTSRRVTVDQLEFPPRLNTREILPHLNQTQNFATATETPPAATPAPVLAHRAVETILNVVEAQRQSAANASSVNLHFKFGTDDLAVRVQMRGGEVQTQFITDSPELRSALSSEWQVMAGQGGASALRLHEPVIMPASAGTSSGFGSTTHGQNQPQQHAQQQQERAAMGLPEFHPLRRGASGVVPATTVTPRVLHTPSTSQHLTATA